MYMHDMSKKRHFMNETIVAVHHFHFRLTDARAYVTLISNAGSMSDAKKGRGNRYFV